MTLPLFGAMPQPAGLPTQALEILAAARIVHTTVARVRRGGWGLRIGQKRRWVVGEDGCCAVGALLLLREAVAEPRDHSPIHAASRELGVLMRDVYWFTVGFDGVQPDDGGEWYGYGARVARELGV